jgi:hypothetical protein
LEWLSPVTDRALAPPGGGEGKLDYLVPGLLGFLAGAVLYGLTYNSFPGPVGHRQLWKCHSPRPVERQRLLFIVLFPHFALIVLPDRPNGSETDEKSIKVNTRLLEKVVVE